IALLRQTGWAQPGAPSFPPTPRPTSCPPNARSLKRLLSQREQIFDLSRRKLGEPCFARANHLPRCHLLTVDHFIDLLLQGACANELVNLHVPLLANAKRAVGRLVFDSGVPPSVEMKHVVRGREIQSR